MKPEKHPQTLHRVEVEQYVDPSAEWQTGFWLQYSTLTRRTFKCQMGRYFSKFFLGKLLFLSIVTGFVWLGMTRTEDMARDRLGVVLQLFLVLFVFLFLSSSFSQGRPTVGS